MTKVHILIPCSHCNGSAYLPIGETISATGEPYIRHTPCPTCEGSGMAPKWVSLQEFTALLLQAQCPHRHTSYRGSLRLSQGEPWDDITEYCDDCGAKLDGNSHSGILPTTISLDIP